MMSALLALLAATTPSPAAPTPPADRALAREIFQQLVEIDTSQSNGDTTRAAEAVAARLRAAGFPAADIQVLGPSPRKGNLVARLHGSGRERPLLLLAHLDVVDARRSDWSLDPFRFTEQGGYFYGRGTQDDKSLAALWISTMIRLRREGRRLDRDVILALTADEEAGPEDGVAWLLAHHRPLIDAALCLTEAGNGQIKDGRHLAIHVQPTEKSYLTLELSVTNKGGHSSLPEPDNAIVRLADALGRVHRHTFPVEVVPAARGYFERMAALTPGPLAADMRAVAGARPDPAAAERLSRLPHYNACLRTTCVPTQISGGHAENALPQAARATVNCRVLPGHSADEVVAALRAAIDDAAVKIDVKETPITNLSSPLPPDFVSTIERAGAAVWPGVPVVPILLAGATDGRFLRAAGIPTYGLTGLFVDVADIRAHGRDERLLVSSFFDAQDFLYRLILDLTRASADADPRSAR
jgi:acetylornithine deacetylase/succinyl-diaminopimelate desuccinylase-like protein